MKNNKKSITSAPSSKNAADEFMSENVVSPPNFLPTANGIQLKAISSTDPSIQMKRNPFQMKKQEEEEEIQLKKGPFQMKAEEEEPLQAKKNPSFENSSSSKSTSNTSLPENVQMKMESAFNADFSNVNIHSNSTKAEGLGAQAYAQGSDVHFAPGKYNPESQSGQELLGHELTHVVQQRQGRVSPTTQMKGANVNDDTGLENEADQMGKRAAANKPTGLSEQNNSSVSDVIQGNFLSDLWGSISGEVKKYNEAISRHKQNVAKVKVIIEGMKSGNTIEKNSAEWVEDGRTGFYVGTMTHDAAKRGKKITGKDGKLAYFGSKTPSEKYPSDIATYSTDIDSNANIITANATTVGLNWGTHFNVLDPIKKGVSDAYIKETIIHEVQHTADRHHDEDGYSTGGASKAWVRYKTEFRSYWVEQGTHDSKSTKTGTGTGGFDNEKQQSIFNALYGSYDYVKTNYDADALVSTSENAAESGKKFKELAKGYSTSEGINLSNSIRVDDFYKALESCNNTMGSDDNAVKELFKAIDNLSVGEKVSITGGDDKTRLRKMMKNNLSEEIQSKVQLSLAVGDFNVGVPDGSAYA